MSDLTPELIADIEEALLGHWDDDVMAIVRRPYSPHALSVYAWRGGGIHIATDGAEDGGAA
jgi:hypothetical protein